MIAGQDIDRTGLDGIVGDDGTAGDPITQHVLDGPGEMCRGVAAASKQYRLVLAQVVAPGLLFYYSAHLQHLAIQFERVVDDCLGVGGTDTGPETVECERAGGGLLELLSVFDRLARWRHVCGRAPSISVDRMGVETIDLADCK